MRSKAHEVQTSAGDPSQAQAFDGRRRDVFQRGIAWASTVGAPCAARVDRSD